MKTTGDLVLEHAEQYKGDGTSEGLRFLELPHKPEHYGSANMYCAALAIIRELQKEVESLRHEQRHS